MAVSLLPALWLGCATVALRERNKVKGIHMHTESGALTMSTGVERESLARTATIHYAPRAPVGGPGLCWLRGGHACETMLRGLLSHTRGYVVIRCCYAAVTLRACVSCRVLFTRVGTLQK